MRSAGGTIPGLFRKVARERGDKRPGSLRAGMPIKVHRSAAQMRLGRAGKPKQGAHDVRPGPKANGIIPL